jgi:DNA-binding IclR family transcriptional regulator
MARRPSPPADSAPAPGARIQGIQSIEIGFRLIRALVEASTPLPLRQVAESGGMSPSKARMYLVSLMRIGFISQAADTGLYTLGPFAAEIGAAARQRTDLLAAAQLAMEELGAETGALMLLAAWGPGGLTLLRQTDGAEALPIDFRVGGPVSLTRTATGHVCLAFLPSTATAAIRAAEVAENARNAELRFLNDAYLDTAAAAVRATGTASVGDVRFASGVVLIGYTAVAAPIFDETGALRFVLTALVRKRRPRLELAATRTRLRETAERLSGPQHTGRRMQH